MNNKLFSKQKQLLNYWRASIKTETICGASLDRDQYDKYIFEKSAIKDSSFNQNKTHELFQTHKDITIHRKIEHPLKNKDASTEEYLLPILISPLIYQKKHEHGADQFANKKKYIHPIWIVAFLDETGNIFADYPCEIPPWIAREYLEPVHKHDSWLIIGELAKYDEFLDKNAIVAEHQYKTATDDDSDDNNKSDNEEQAALQKVTYEQLRNYAKKMFEAVAPNFATIIRENGYFHDEKKQFILMPTDKNKNEYMTLHMRKLLDSLSGTKETFSPLLSRYLNLEKSPDQGMLPPYTQLTSETTQHFGQMSNKFALAKSQRTALHHLLSISTGEVLAINGPPGTGKTTFVQSVVASAFVKAVLDKTLPPIIVVSSTNNRAILNVLDNFQLGHAKNLLSGRWIEGLNDFGLYLTKPEKKDKYQWYSKDSTGTIQNLAAESLVQHEAYFLKKFNEYFNSNTTSPKDAQDFLEQKIRSLAKILQNGLIAATAIAKTQHVYQDISYEEKITKKTNFFTIKQQQMQLQWQQMPPMQQKYLVTITQDKTLWQKIEHSFISLLSTKSTKLELQKYLRNRNRVELLLKAYKKKLNDWNAINNKWQTWQQQNQVEGLDIENLFDFTNESNQGKQTLLHFLDTNMRYTLFYYAVHYWEARWLIAIPSLKTSNEIKGQDLEAKIKHFKTMAMLTPCFVVTMHSGPSYFTCKISGDKDYDYMKDGIDLLIIDEAGQVNPAYATGMMALAKKACVIGDNLQLPPIGQIPTMVDVGNLRQYEFLQNSAEYCNIAKLGINVAKDARKNIGSAMKIAQNISCFQEDFSDEASYCERGLFLAEHRRCVPEIISYCNKRFYDSRMICKRNANPKRAFPALGYAHISGFQQNINGSQANWVEAESIVEWIIEKQQEFAELYPGYTTKQIFGIITPFAQQAKILIEACKERNLGLTSDNIGTIHKFQGGEYPVIIFSPVYTYKDNDKEYFFDAETTMLNVVVSRARDHLFVFGDMDIFDPKNGTLPSGALAQHLFSNPENELSGIKIVRSFKETHPTIQQISTLNEHRVMLRDAFLKAQEEIVIVSPWIRKHAIEADNIAEYIQTASNKGVNITIYTDYANNFTPEAVKNQTMQILQVLQNAGATIKVIANIHAKTLFVDNNLFIEGSFNWLSASREGQYVKYDASICYRGIAINSFISNTLKNLQNRQSKAAYPAKKLDMALS